LIYKNQH
jgi:hypothetical protein